MDVDYDVVSAQVGAEQLLYGSLVDIQGGAQFHLHVADFRRRSWRRLRSGESRTCQNLRYENGSANHVGIISLYVCYTMVITMRKNLTRIGNSLGLVIEKPILELLDINQETELEVTTDGKRLTIVPVHSNRKRRIGDAAKRAMDVHENTFRRLAK